MGKKKVRRTYSEEFKANAVKMSLKPGVSVSQVAEELDVPVGYLSKWRSDARVAQDQASAEARVDAISENQSLKDELKRVKLGLVTRFLFLRHALQQLLQQTRWLPTLYRGAPPTPLGRGLCAKCRVSRVFRHTLSSAGCRPPQALRSGRVRISGRPFVITIVCSYWAAK
jgi:transposase